MSEPIVGIDLGTSNMVIAHAPETGVQVLADANGFRIHPSVVSFHPNGGVVVGAAAKQRKVIDPKNTIYSVKRLIGRTWSAPEVQTARQRMPYQIKQGPNELPLIVTRGGEFAVPEISAIVLDHAKRFATAALQTPVSRAVVTVPASFNDAQRFATATAGSIAGLEVVRVINEPTAAALSYGNARDLRETIAVYDFGGGTFDITLLKLDHNVYEVLGTAGDTFLGGDDLDERLVDRMVEKFLAEQRVDLRTNEVSMMRLRAVAEQTKIELSRRARAVIRIDEIAYGPNGKPLDLQIEVRRDEFVQYIADIVARTFPVCEEALRLANLTIDHVDDVLLVGGTTKMPYVREQVSRFFAKAPRTDVNPDDAVACGAALQALALQRAPADVEPALDLTLAPPDAKRMTAGYAGRRAASRGDHHDIFEERTPPPASPNAPVIGRLTRGGPPPVPRATQPTLATSRPPAVPAASPQAKTLVVEPPAKLPSTTLRGMPLRDDTAFGNIKTEKQIVDLDFANESSIEIDPSLGFEDDSTTDFDNIGTEKGIVDVPLEPMSRTPKASAPTVMVEPSPAPTSLRAPVAPPRVPIVMDVTPRGLGIGTVAGFCEELIRRNSRVPTEIRKVFTTSRDGQNSVRIIVCQGESRRLDNNIVIGDLKLDDLPPRPRGETSIEVTFMLDANGILQVRARDAHTGKEQRASLDIVGTIPEEDVSASRERVQSLRR